jgi:hypothetical protein
MGITSSRKVLLESPEPRKSELYPKPDVKPITPTDRLVCYQLRKETQRGLHNKKPKARDRVSIVQVTPQSLQQEDVRSVLPVEEDSISRSRYNGRPAELL